MVWEYIQNIYNTIVLKDVVQREGLRNVTLFENLMSYVSDNAGQLVSATSLSKYLKSQRVELTPLSAINYLKAASNAYIINKVSRYDIHGKRLLEINTENKKAQVQTKEITASLVDSLGEAVTREVLARLPGQTQ